MVHRDVSPHNVLVSFGGDVKIIDFGVAKARGKENHTKAGVIKGKLLYMAPEQAMAKDIDGRADLFAAGLILYGMLTNHLPFEGDNEFQIYNNILLKDVPPRAFNPMYPEDLNQIVMMLLQRDPDKRYQDGHKADLDSACMPSRPGTAWRGWSAWIEDNFTQIAIAKRQRRENPSGRNLPETPAHFNQTSLGGAPEQAPAYAQAVRFDAATGIWVVLFPAQPASISWIAASASGAFPTPSASGAFPSPSASGAFPGYGGIPTPSGGFQNVGFGSGQFQAAPNPSQSGMFAAPPQVAPEPAEKSVPIVLVGAIFMVVALIAVMVFVLVTRAEQQPVVTPAPSPTPATTAAQAEAAVEPEPEPEPELEPEPEVVPVVEEEPLERVSVMFASEPAGAMIYLNGEAIGPTPVSLPYAKSDDEVTFEAKLEGYQDAQHAIVPNEDVSFTFTLVSNEPEKA
ncbi:MAG: serine/threonine-protein kinase [bacterium]